MSAFNDYCLVCEKICTGRSVYCSDECKNQDTQSHFEFSNAPQLISPVLQPRQDSIASLLESDEEVEEEQTHQDYLIRSPMLLSSTLKNEHTIAGLSLDNVPTEPSPKELEPQLTGSLAASSNYYRKWLSVSHH